jgi:hypothetical protein
MATVDKNFKVKNGLVVEGTTATVNGNDIITTANTYRDNISNTVVLRDGFGNFAAGQIDLDSKLTAPDVRLGNAGQIHENNDGALEVNAYSSNDLVLHGDQNVIVTTNNADIDLRPDGNATVWGNAIATQNYVDGLAGNYDPAGAASAAEANANSYTDGKVSALVDSAPDLLNTLNELAAAIADNPNYATDVANLVATKADVTYVETQLSAVDTAAQGYASTAETNAKNYAKSYADGLASNYDAAGSATTAEDNAKSYADSLAVNYDPAGSAASAQHNAEDYADSLASNYDAAGAALAAEGNAKAYADSLAVNYDPAGTAATSEAAANAYTDTAIANGNNTATPIYAGVKIGFYAQEIAGWAIGNTSDTVIALTLPSGYKSGKFNVRVMSNSTGDSQMSEILVTADASNNVAITEYAIVSTNGNMGDVTADVDLSGNITIVVVPTHDSSEVMVSGTAYVWND